MLAGALRLASDIRDVLERRRLMDEPEFADARAAQYDVLLYFADRPKNFYQLRQWLAPLEELAKTRSTAIVCTRGDTSEMVRARTLLPVVVLDGPSRDARLITIQRPKVILYVNQNNDNFRPLRFNAPLHVFICHGESDKIYMSTNLLKAFNYDFVAGPAAEDRLAGNLFEYDVTQRAIRIGRPQLDHPIEGPELPDDGRVVVMYAPTWEGYRPTMRYSSVGTHGETIVETLTANKRFRVIYRPHPLTGTMMPAIREADERIRMAIRAANDVDVAAGHIVDESAFGWQMDAADVLITDISAVAYDWLTTAKPQLLTRPVDPGAAIDNTVLLARLPQLDVHDTPRIAEVIDSISTDAATRDAMRRVCAYYYGDLSEGTSTRRFIAGIERLTELYDEHTDALDSTMTPRETSSVTLPATELADKLVEHTCGMQFVSRQAGQLDAVKPARFVVIFHASDDQATDTFDRWVSALERLDRDYGVVVMVGNTRALRHVQQTSTLHCFLVYGSAQPEQVVRAVAARVLIHLEQSDLNFRETSIHDVLHVFIGSENFRAWQNNRLRVFDRVLVPDETDALGLSTMLRDFAAQTRARVVGENGEMKEAHLVDALMAAADQIVELRDRRERRRRRIEARIAAELDTDDGC